MQKPPQGHTEEYRSRDLVKRRADTKRRVERAQESQGVKLARYIDQQDKTQEP